MKKIIVIVGPTGIGKTKLSIALAHHFNGEVINADSTQVYKGLDIATAKVTKDEMENIVHHLLDIKNIMEDYTVFDYQADSRKVIEDIINRGKTPIMVGGTGLYIKASLYDYQFSDEQINSNYEDISDEALYHKLLAVDPETNIHMNNRKRIIRAINYYELKKEPFSSKEKTDKLLYDAIFIGLTTNRGTLYSRLNNRVDLMIENGLLNEAFQIYDSKVRSKAIMTPIGYKELFDYFDNQKSLAECIDLIKQRSRKYAKRQYTWFNNQIKVQWINVDFEDFDQTIKESIKFIEEQ